MNMDIVLIIKRLVAFIIGVAIVALIAGPGDFTQALLFISDVIIKLIFTSLKF